MINTILMARSILDCTCGSNHADWVAEDQHLSKVVASVVCVVSFCNSINKIGNLLFLFLSIQNYKKILDLINIILMEWSVLGTVPESF